MAASVKLSLKIYAYYVNFTCTFLLTTLISMHVFCQIAGGWCQTTVIVDWVYKRKLLGENPTGISWCLWSGQGNWLTFKPQFCTYNYILGYMQYVHTYISIHMHMYLHLHCHLCSVTFQEQLSEKTFLIESVKAYSLKAFNSLNWTAKIFQSPIVHRTRKHVLYGLLSFWPLLVISVLMLVLR